MTKWEYRQVNCYYQHTGKILGWLVQYEGEAELWSVERALNHAGAQGWELVGSLACIISGSGYSNALLLKRPLQS